MIIKFKLKIKKIIYILLFKKLKNLNLNAGKLIITATFSRNNLRKFTIP